MSTQPPRAGRPVLHFTIWYHIAVGQDENGPVWSDDRDQTVFAHDAAHAQRVFSEWAGKMFGNLPFEIVEVR